MEVIAVAKYIHISAQKCRLVADQVRLQPVEKAIDILQFSKKKGAVLVKKVLNSAIANAENNEGVDIDKLFINRIMVDEASVLKRFRARAKGRGNRILKKTSHIMVSISDKPIKKLRK